MFTVEVQCMAIYAKNKIKNKLMNRPAASSSVSMQLIILPETWRHSRTCTFFDWFVLSRCVFVSSISVSCPSVVVRRPTNRMAGDAASPGCFFASSFSPSFLVTLAHFWTTAKFTRPVLRIHHRVVILFLLSGRTCMVPPEADSLKVTFGKGVERVDWLVHRLYLLIFWTRVQSTYHGMCGGNTHSRNKGNR